MATEVSVLDKYGDVTYYSNYADARADIINSGIEHPLVQIWADLDEQIILLDEVDIWIAPGVTLNRTEATPTIIDNVTGTNTEPVKCKIFGYGKIKNTYAGGTENNRFESIKTINPSTELEVTCDHIQGIGGITISIIYAPSINIFNGKKFHLTCNKVVNNKTCAILLGDSPNSVQNHIDDVNIKVQKIEIDSETTTNSESIAIASLATGFIEVDEIICRHYGHCLLHARGDVTATIRKMSVLNNTNFSGGIVRIDHGGSTASQKLILYFDSILALKVSSAISGSAYAIAQGTGILIGRLIYSKNNYVAQLNGNTTTIIGSIKCNEMVSETGPALEIGEKVSGLIINCNFIIGTTETEAGLIFSKGTAIYLIKNAKLINNSTNSGSRGISLFLFSSSYPNLTLWNVKVVLNESSTNYIIYANNSPSTDVDVYNFGLFGIENYDVDNIDLKIGFEGSAGGFLFIEDTDLE